MPWSQNYDPFGHAGLSTLVAALPVGVLLGLVALGHLRTWLAALIGLGSAVAVALFGFRMPMPAALGATAYGAAYGLFPIGWIVLNVMFLHALTVRSGRFDTLRHQLARIAPDPRLQLILVAYCFGGFIEGSAGFGAPVAITAAMLMQLGFKPLEASALTLIANTAPVAFGSVGIPITTLAQVTGLDVFKLSQMAGRQLPVFSLIIPFWIVWAWGGWRAVRGVWPAALTAGASFAVVQALVSNLHGPLLVDTAAGLASILAFVALLALGNVTKYSGADATLGLALANTGAWYPFFGTLLGWLGVALTGSDTASNVLFGGLQKITAQQLDLSPYLMAAANSVGGVMGKMIDAQSIVVAGVATGLHGAEGRILRRVFLHSLALVVLVGIYVTLQARWPLMQRLVIH